MTIDRIAEPPPLFVQPALPLPAEPCGSLWNDYLHRLLGGTHGCMAGGEAANDEESDPGPACCCAVG